MVILLRYDKNLIKKSSQIRNEILKIDDDPIYIWILIPSILSCITSLVTIIKIIIYKDDLKKLFHQFALIMASVDIVLYLFSQINALLSFIGPRYEISTKLCYFQEYLFQWAVLSKMFIILMISNSIFRAIKHGHLWTWRNNFFCIYCALFVFGCAILSISFQTVELFCPFNEDNELYYKNWSNDTHIHIRYSIIAVFCFYITPLGIALNLSCFYSFQSIYLSRQSKRSVIANIVFKLGLNINYYMYVSIGYIFYEYCFEWE